MQPVWLPALLLLEDHHGDWLRYFEAVYAAFEQDFVMSKPEFRGKRLGLKRHPEYDGKSATFWHMMSTGEDEAEQGLQPDKATAKDAAQAGAGEAGEQHDKLIAAQAGHRVFLADAAFQAGGDHLQHGIAEGMAE